MTSYLHNPPFRSRTASLILGLGFLAAYLLVYGYIILRFGLNQDEILDFRGEAMDSYLAAGRWGIPLYKEVFVQGCAPFTAGVVSGIYLAIAFVLQTKLLELKNIASIIVFGALYLSVPQLTCMQVYSMQVDSMAFGLLLSTASVTILAFSGKNCWKIYGIAIALLALAVSMYQTILAHFVILYVAFYLQKSDIETNINVRKAVLDFVLVVCVAVAVWVGGVKLTLAAGMIDPPTLHAMSAYQESLVSSWRSFADWDILDKARFLGFIGKQFVLCCLGLHYSTWWMVTLTVVPVGILMARYFMTRRSCKGLLIKAGCLLLIWGLPHAYILYMVNYQGGRIAPAEPLACACLWGMALRPANVSSKGFFVVCGISLFLLIKASYETTSLAWKERVEYEQQCGELRALYHAAQSEAATHGLSYGSYEIVVVNASSIHREKVSQPWTSNFSVVHWFARYLNLPKMRGCLADEITPALKKALSTRTPWPAPNCCCVQGNRVYVITARPSGTALPYSYPIVPYANGREDKEHLQKS